MKKVNKYLMSLIFIVFSLILIVYNQIEKKSIRSSSSFIIADSKDKKIEKPVPNCQRCVQGTGT